MAQAWRLVGDNAELVVNDLRATLSLRSVFRGVAKISRGNRSLPGCELLAVNVPGQEVDGLPREAYGRGDDLIIRFGPGRDDQVSRQLDYRLIACGDSVTTLELVLSAQTELSRSDPRIDVFCRFGPAQLLSQNGNATGCELIEDSCSFAAASPRPKFFLLRLVEPDDVSVVCLVHPTDFCEATVRRDGSKWSLCFKVFPEPLEKGVIRRGTLRCVMTDRIGDEARASSLCDEFSSSPPPLGA